MVNHEPKDAAPAQICITGKRKRPVSEQEHRERKRAVDRRAQRSLREKTKIHIAKLERTIEILQNKDRNDTTSTLLSEIDALRAENERLKHTIESVKSLVGLNVVSQDILPTKPGPVMEHANRSPAAAAVGHSLPEPPTISIAGDPQPSPLPHLNQSTSIDRTIPGDEQQRFDQPKCPEQPDFFQPSPFPNGPTVINQLTTAAIDLDGITIIPDIDEPTVPDTNKKLAHSPRFRPLSECLPKKQSEELLQAIIGKDPFSSLMQEIMGAKVILSFPHHSPHRRPFSKPHNVQIRHEQDGF
ncbi:hypothetical protein COCMIDRAFT_108759 [Bipolaris oryzae ATCC 44560]|uniref:BZIP domain-containing protein n=1 Tax=Bipolaris oryzae ATCC 44560 TaxID=930090 RepID=W6YMF0_COCMI|nr:uncharacterized protein COCMIDRAFT_108759 [Bipolaris oryzae ATCC 44560]EUC40462.1 hypothetical protein COCMIDRAFT_108759 [Bipolaris oryzae ATCC 44560]